MKAEIKITEERSDVTEITKNYMDSVLIEERLIDSREADTKATLLGKTFDSPIMLGAFSYLGSFGSSRDSATVEYAKTAKKLNIAVWAGMMEDEEFQEILDTGVGAIRIIKPYADKEKIYRQIEYSQKNGAIAVGMDIDHIFGTDGKYDVVTGEKMGPQTMTDISDYVRYSGVPFIVKGVLSVTDAVKCAECGVQGIVVSHHHGRMPYAVPPAVALKKIKAELGGTTEMKMFMDCAIDTGADTFKALAMGADAVCVGRVTYPVLKDEGTDGLERYLTRMNQELAMIMGFTGSPTIKDIDPSVLHREVLY